MGLLLVVLGFVFSLPFPHRIPRGQLSNPVKTQGFSEG